MGENANWLLRMAVYLSAAMVISGCSTVASRTEVNSAARRTIHILTWVYPKNVRNTGDVQYRFDGTTCGKGLAGFEMALAYLGKVEDGSTILMFHDAQTPAGALESSLTTFPYARNSEQAESLRDVLDSKKLRALMRVKSGERSAQWMSTVRGAVLENECEELQSAIEAEGDDHETSE